MDRKYIKRGILIVVATLIVIVFILVFDTLKSEQSNIEQSQEETTVEEITETEPQETHVAQQITQEEKMNAMLVAVTEDLWDVEYVEEYKEDKNMLTEEIELLESYKEELISFNSDVPVKYKAMFDEAILPEVDKINNALDQYYADLEHINLWERRMEEHPAATQAWLFMKEQGWNDAVCAGILGNMMIECGGHTLDLRWWLYDSSGWFYGLCQWHKGYFPEVQGQSLEYQLQYLVDTMHLQFDPWSDTALERFLNITDPSEAAYVFALKYERCLGTEWNYTSRQNCAWVAYKYFCND